MSGIYHRRIALLTGVLYLLPSLSIPLFAAEQDLTSGKGQEPSMLRFAPSDSSILDPPVSDPRLSDSIKKETTQNESQASSPTTWYRKWWVWALTGAVVAGVAIGGSGGGGGSSGDGSGGGVTTGSASLSGSLP